MPPDMRDKAIELMRHQQFSEALSLFQELIAQNPQDGTLLYMAGQCLRFLNELTSAIKYFQKAIEVDFQEPEVFKCLGIALQLNEQYNDAVVALGRAIDIDPNYVLAYNSLALTQKKMGQLEKALHNYDAGARALARRIVINMHNIESNSIFKTIPEGHNLWAEYAMYGAFYLCSLADNVEKLAWPTGEQAAQEEATEQHGGLLWVDQQSVDGKNVRLFLPNYFNTFRVTLKVDSSYPTLIGNRGTVLDLLGRHSDAKKHFEEALEFMSQK